MVQLFSSWACDVCDGKKGGGQSLWKSIHSDLINHYTYKNDTNTLNGVKNLPLKQFVLSLDLAEDLSDRYELNYICIRLKPNKIKMEWYFSYIHGRSGSKPGNLNLKTHSPSMDSMLSRKPYIYSIVNKLLKYFNINISDEIVEVVYLTSDEILAKKYSLVEF